MATLRFRFKVKDLIEAGRTTDDDILAMKEWQNSTRYPNLTDEQIVLFLISCKNDHDNAKRTIETYFDSKIDCPEIFYDRNVDNDGLRNMAEVVTIAVLPKRYNGSAIMSISLKDTNYKHYDARYYAQLVTMTIESLYFSADPPRSITTIFDVKGYTFMHITRMRLRITKGMSEFQQKGYPVEIGQIYLINANAIAHAGMNLFKPFMKSDVLAKVEIYRAVDGYDWFHKHIPKEYLPMEYEGDLESVQFYHDENLRTLRELQPYFEEMQRQVYSPI